MLHGPLPGRDGDTEAPASLDAAKPAGKPAAKRESILDSWAMYAAQPVLPAVFALALLYLTVMSLGERCCKIM